MAAGYGTYNYSRAAYRKYDQNSYYVYGNVVRQAQAAPLRRPQVQERPAKPKRASRQALKNRNRAMTISPAYALFLTVAAVCAVLVCVLYLNMQAGVVSRSENVTALQEELADLTEANTTRYNAAANSVNMETVRDRAMNEMGMVYASQGTVIEYDRPAGDYVKQYSDIPESGVLAKSGSFTR